MKKVLVLGALGFIGFAICKRFLRDGHEVIGIDCIEENYKHLKEQKLLEIARNSSFTFIDKKLEQVDLTAVVEKCDLVYYCLLDLNLNTSNFTDKIIGYKQNLQKVMGLCNKLSSKLIYLSSYEVFREGQMDGQASLSSPRNIVGQVKKIEEDEIIKYGQKNERFAFFIIRIPTIYGPWQPPHMTFEQIINGNEPIEYDPIQEDILYIDDLVEELMTIPNAKQKNQTILLKSDAAFQWEEVLDILKKVVHTFPKKGFTAEHAEHFSSNESSNSAQRKRTPIEEGIRRQVQHHSYIQKLKNFGLL